MFSLETNPRFTNEFKEVPGQLRIGVDIDGVVSDNHCLIQRALLAQFGIDIDQLIEAMVAQGKKVPYDFRQWPELVGGKAIDFIEQFYQQAETYQEAEAIEASIVTLNHWQQQEHRIWFITSRPPSMARVTLSWLQDHLAWVTKEQLILGGRLAWNDNHGAFKPEIARKLGLHLMIEDNDSTLAAMDQLVLPHLMTKILIAHSYNRINDAGFQVLRTEDWREVDQAIQKASQWHYFLHDVAQC